MPDFIATRTKKLKPSATMAVSTKANELKAQGEKIINLSVGEPDFDTPKHIVEAAYEALKAGFTRYTAVDGLPELKTAIQTKFKNDNDLHYDLSQLIVSTGGKQCLFNLFLSILNPGDEVIIPAPYWVSYPSMVTFAEGVPRVISTTIDDHYKITAKQLESTITPRTRAFVINSPSNPSGQTYTQTELKAIADVLEKHPNILIISDDIYEYMTWLPEGYSNILNVAPNLYDRTVIVNGVSKTYAMTGWRIGFTAGPKDIIATMRKIQSQSTSNAAAVSQMAAATAISGDQTCVKTMCHAFQKRHDYVYKRLMNMPGIKAIPSTGTFYQFPDVSDVIKRKQFKDDITFATYLLEEAGIAVVPGCAFGHSGSIRISFSVSDQALSTAMDNLERSIA